jgi:L-alanine-DL-glutamate epimerase-like enolase superfamily enzyme
LRGKAFEIKEIQTEVAIPTADQTRPLIAALAEIARIPWAPLSAGSGVALETALHLTTSTPNCFFAEVIPGILYVLEGQAESVLSKPLEIKDGHVPAYDCHGFGGELDEEVVERYTVYTK